MLKVTQVSDAVLFGVLQTLIKVVFDIQRSSDEGRYHEQHSFTLPFFRVTNPIEFFVFKPMTTLTAIS